MEATEAKLDIKVTQLKMSIEKTNTILEAGKPEAIETPYGPWLQKSIECD